MHACWWWSDVALKVCFRRVPAASVVLNVFLLGSVTGAAWARFGVWVGGTLVVFLLYGLPASYAHHTSRFGCTPVKEASHSFAR